MTLAPSDFAQILRLPLDDVRATVTQGDPTERVWAAWALGLRLSPTAAGILADAARGEPDPGVRRHLAVVLTGLGEQGAVEELAHSDPDARVRATACRCLALLARQIPRYAEMLGARVAAEEEIVKVAILEALPTHLTDTVRTACVRLVGDVSLDVRQSVAERLPEWLPPGAALPPLVLHQAAIEPDRWLRRRLLGFCLARDDVASVAVAVAASGASSCAIDLLDLLDASQVSGWTDLAALSGLGLRDVDRRLLALFAGRWDGVPLAWLLRCLEGLPSWQLLSVQVVRQLVSRLRAVAPSHLSPPDVARLSRLGDIAAQALEEPPVVDYDLDEDEGGGWGSDEERDAYSSLVSTLVEEARRLQAASPSRG